VRRPDESFCRRRAGSIACQLTQWDFWLWSRADTHRYFLAGQGLDEEFNAPWSIAVGESGEFGRAIADRSYAAAGGTIGYLVSGRKPG
jgi:hypothetical protein